MHELDCSELKTCISDLINEADNPDTLAYKQYLESAPVITDPADFQQCGEVRNYFGFDEMFLNDYAVCEDVSQLRYSRSFEFLKDFFGGAPTLLVKRLPSNHC